MNLHENKIQELHTQRKAYVYVRQSTMAQIQEHQESTKRQYELYQRALQLGWTDSQIEIIDDDLGHSASDVSLRRVGYQKLLSKVVTGEVGAIFSVEISRLARQDSEGHRLVEVATLTETLLIDEQQVYDPRLSDDRLILGLKVLLSSNEIRLMGHRLRENQFRKAQRGELRLNVPVGLIFIAHVGIQIDPDEQVQGAIRLLFERFRLSGRLSAVARYFHENGLLYPRRKGTWHGKLEWGQLSSERVRAALANPLYAGAYVYGRSKRHTVIHSENHIERPRHSLPQNEWAVVYWNTFKGYISQEDYEANQTFLAKNQTAPHMPASSHRRNGPALLGGKLLCGKCGQPMHVGYQGTNGSRSVYLCNARQIHYGQSTCQRIPGKAVDHWVTEMIMAALTPAQIEVSLAVVEELERQVTELNRQWQRRLEAARYATDLAHRRYEEVEPENRLVARTLEKEWEAGLQEINRLETEFTAFCKNKAPTFAQEQRESLFRLSTDLPKIWSSPTTTWTERKDLLELLIADVTLTRNDTGITVQLRWFTNEVETTQLPLPLAKGGVPPSPVLIERIHGLCEQYTDGEIANILNRDGMKTSRGSIFTAKSVEMLRWRNKISKHCVQP